MSYKRILGWVLAALAAAPFLACGGDETPPAAAADSGLVAVYGDSRTGHEVHERVIAAIDARKPALVFHTGDLVADGHSMTDWNTFNRITAPLRAHTPFYPALGNHEDESPLYFANFDLPGNEQWYAVRRFGAHLIILDTNVPFGPGSSQYQWLADELAANEDRYLLVLFHNPPFSLTREEETTLRVREYLVPLFEAHGVNAVFCGHDHNYERFLVNGITYVITGGGGAPLYGRTRNDPRNKKFARVNHYCMLDITPDHLQLDVYDLDGHSVDSYKIK